MFFFGEDLKRIRNKITITEMQVANFRDLGGYARLRSTGEVRSWCQVIDLRFPSETKKNCRTDWDRIWTISTVRLWVPQSWNSWIL